jgi:hypothetical protein
VGFIRVIPGNVEELKRGFLTRRRNDATKNAVPLRRRVKNSAG